MAINHLLPWAPLLALLACPTTRLQATHDDDKGPVEPEVIPATSEECWAAQFREKLAILPEFVCLVDLVHQSHLAMEPGLKSGRGYQTMLTLTEMCEVLACSDGARASSVWTSRSWGRNTRSDVVANIVVVSANPRLLCLPGKLDLASTSPPVRRDILDRTAREPQDVNATSHDVFRVAVMTTTEDVRRALGLSPLERCILPVELVAWAYVACASACVPNVDRQHQQLSTPSSESAAIDGESRLDPPTAMKASDVSLSEDPLPGKTTRGITSCILNVANDVVSSGQIE